MSTFPTCKNCYLIAWTTTPWTLPHNLALAVNGKIDYCALIIALSKKITTYTFVPII